MSPLDWLERKCDGIIFEMILSSIFFFITASRAALKTGVASNIILGIMERSSIWLVGSNNVGMGVILNSEA